MKTNKKTCPKCDAELENQKSKICPSCGAKLSTPIFKKWWFWVLIVLVVIIIASAGGGDTEIEEKESDDTQMTDNGEANNDEKVTSVKYEQVDLQKMLDDLNGNALRAENTYQNKYIEVVGKISNFDSDGSYISIEPINASEWNFETVMCYIKNDSQRELLLQKNVGDTVTIKGKVISVGEILGYSINIDEIK